MTPCECTGPGFCERHGCHKSRHWWRLCRTRYDRFREWEAGEGPGQEEGSPVRSLRCGAPEVTVLMVTFDRLEYTRLAVPALLASEEISAEFVVWDNASTDGTREWLIEQFADDPRVSLILSSRNVGCVHPMNVVWGSARTPLVVKVDNDTLVPPELLSRLAAMHRTSRRWGVLSGCHFRPEDVSEIDDTAPGGPAVFQQPHVGGCAVMMRQAVFSQFGPIPCLHAGGKNPFLESTWTEYQEQLHRSGLVNGYPLPLTFVDHMEDTRSDHCIRSDAHEEYKAAMRGLSLEDCTEKYYVEGASKTLDRGARVTGDAASEWELEPGRVTLFLPLSGRASLWPELAEFLDRQTWPRERTSLVLMETSQDDDFAAMVRDWVSHCDYPDVRVLRESVGRAGVADEPRREATPDVQAAMTRIYRRLQVILQTEFVWVLEDDILPPDNVGGRLMSLLEAGHDSAAAPYRSRFGDRFVAWDRDGRNHTAGGHGIESVGGNGFGCTLLRSEALLNATFLEGEDCDRGFYAQLQRMGGSAAADWSCECEHRGETDYGNEATLNRSDGELTLVTAEQGASA